MADLTSLEIRKISVDTWVIIENGIEANFRGQNKYTGGIDGDYVNIKSLNGAQEYKRVPFSIISYTDTITPANSRASFSSSQEFLIYGNQTGFFIDGGSGTGGATSFDALTDTPNSKIGSAGKSVVVSEDEATLEYTLIPIINNSTDIADFPQELIEGKYLKIVGGVYKLVDGIEGDQNNIGFKRSYGSSETAPTKAQILTKINASPLVVGEQQTPVILYIVSLEGAGGSLESRNPAKIYSWLFLGGKGTYGLGGTRNVLSSDLFPLETVNMTPDDIDPAYLSNLDPVVDGDFVTKANTTFWDFSDSTYPEPGINYYFSYTDDGVLYYALFIGTPGTYGTGGTPFTEDDFVTTTSNEVDPTIPLDPDNYLKLTGELFQDVEGEVNIQKLTVTQTPTDPQDVTTKTYVDGLTMGLLRLAGNWDASTGTYPTTGTGTGGIVRRGDSYIVTVAGTIYGQVFGIGDSFYSLVNNPAQIPSNWGRFEVPTGQATDVMAGILLLFGTTGTSTIGTMTQKAITDALALKANDADVLHTNSTEETKTGNLNLGTNLESPTNRKTLKMNAGGYAMPGAFGVNSDGDKFIFWRGIDLDGGFGISGQGDVWLKVISTNTGGGQSFGSYSIYTSQGTGSPTNRLFVGGTGNVGINNSNPQYLLDVNGMAFINNTLTLKSPTGISPKVLVIQNLSGTEISSISGSGGMVIGSVTASGSITALNIVSSSNVVIPNAPVNGTDGTNKTYVDAATANLANAVLQNGNTFGQSLVLGTNDNFPILFEINGIGRIDMTLNGIGLSTNTSIYNRSSIDTFKMTIPNTGGANMSNNIDVVNPTLVINNNGPTSTVDIARFQSKGANVGGIRNDGRAYGTNGTATNDYVTKQQLDTVANVTKTGTNTQSGNGTATSFSIPHGLGTTPTYWNAVAISAAAGNISYVTANSTNIIVFYSVAPASGTNNLSWNWIAR